MAALYCPTITYDPVTDPFAMKANHYQIERSPGDTFIYECAFDPSTGLPTPFLNSDSIIVATAGAYKSERYCYPGPRAGYAVFFGPGNTFNINGAPVPRLDGQWMSLERGELAAAVAALKAVLLILHKGGILPSDKRLRNVIIKSHSEDLVRGITERVYTWMHKGWIGRGNSKIRDWDLWEELLGLLRGIQDYWGVQVSFWWVPVTWNLNAKRDAGMGTRVPPPFVARRA